MEDGIRRTTWPLFDRLLRRLGADRLPLSPIVAYAVLVVFVEAVVLQGFNVATGRTVVFVDNPLWLVRPVVLLGAAVAVVVLQRRYERTLERSFLSDAPDQSKFETLVPDWLSLVVIGAGVVFTVANALFLLTIPQLYDAGGPARVVRFLVVTPLGYVPVLGTALATYLAIQVLLPRRIAAAGVPLDYLDPENLGGTRPLGELLKLAYYGVMLGLVAYAVATYGPYLLPGPLQYEAFSPPGATINALFTVVWAAAVAAMVYGIYVLHRYMARRKSDLIHQLNREVRDAVDGEWDVREFDVADPPAAYERYRARVEQVASTGEYPATFTMWTQLLVGVMIPKAIQLALSGL